MLVIIESVYAMQLPVGRISYRFRDIDAFCSKILFSYPTIVWRPNRGTPCNINVIYTSLKSTFSGLHFRCLLSNPANFRQNSNRSRASSKVIDLAVNRKRIYHFQLVINSNFVRISEYWHFKTENCLFSTPPLFDAPAIRGNPLEFLDETHPAKTRGMGSENIINLS